LEDVCTRPLTDDRPSARVVSSAMI
jgi:hypothetical protein